MMTKNKGFLIVAPKKADFDRLYVVFNLLENIVKNKATDKEDFEHFSDEEKQIMKKMFSQYGSLIIKRLPEVLYHFTNQCHNILTGCELMMENWADPELDFIDVHPDIKKSFALIERINKDLQSDEPISDNLKGEIFKLNKKYQQEAVSHV